jgi:chromosome segregation ATPase
LHRRRWACNELRIRDLIQGANLNCNYGYTATDVPNRTRQRQWEKAHSKVTVTERQLANQQATIRNLRQRLADLQDVHAQRRCALERQLAQKRLQLCQRQRARQATTRCQLGLRRLRRELADLDQRFQKRQRTRFRQLWQYDQRSKVLCQRLRSRIADRDAIDTPTLCRERDLEKDQIMLNLQILLANLHDWAATHYFAPQWQRLTLEKATQMIYRKAGRVTRYKDRIEVALEPYRYRDQQDAMETTCARFNAANLRWRDGRLIQISVHGLE